MVYTNEQREQLAQKVSTIYAELENLFDGMEIDDAAPFCMGMLFISMKSLGEISSALRDPSLSSDML